MDPDIQAQIDAAKRGTAPAGATPAAAPTGSDDKLKMPVSLHTPSTDRGPAMHDGNNQPGGYGITTVGDAYDEWHRMSPADQRKWAQKLERLGFIKPGEYTFYCPVGDHRAQGMEGKLTVR